MIPFDSGNHILLVRSEGNKLDIITGPKNRTIEFAKTVDIIGLNSSLSNA